MKIRYAKLSDVNALYAIGKDDFKEESWFTRDVLRWTIKSNSKSCWVLEDNGKVIGARLTCEGWGKTAWGWLILIKNDLRNHNLGTILFEETCNLLKKNGMDRIMTDVYVKNKVSVKWHRKMGYKNIGVVKDWFGDGKDAIIFCKYFD